MWLLSPHISTNGSSTATKALEGAIALDILCVQILFHGLHKLEFDTCFVSACTNTILM
jgi:hypothetical protein